MLERRSLMIAETLLEGGDAPEKYTWEGVLWHINKGDYATAYAIGDMIPLDLGSEGNINMQIAAFNTDTLADGSGNKAHISFVSKELLNTNKPMVSSGTSAAGGWESSLIRAYLSETIKPLFPTDLRTQIKSVSKTHGVYNGSVVDQITNDELWIPSDSEVHSTYKPTTSDHIKYAPSSASARDWWMRDSYQSNTFVAYSRTGVYSYYSSDRKCGIALGFCL